MNLADLKLSGEETGGADEQSALSVVAAQVRALRNVSMSHYRALAAKVLKRVVSPDQPHGQSYTYRHLEPNLRKSIRMLVLPLGYSSYSSFSQLADEVTNLRNADAHFHVGFEEDIRQAQADFPALYYDQLALPRVKVVLDILNLYDSLRVHFK
jgi:hypothetical protein